MAQFIAEGEELYVKAKCQTCAHGKLTGWQPCLCAAGAVPELKVNLRDHELKKEIKSILTFTVEL